MTVVATLVATDSQMYRMFQFFLLLIGLIATTAVSIQEKNCQIAIDLSRGDLVDPQPLILTDEKSPSFLLPSEIDTLIIPSYTSILLVCPGANNSFENFEPTKVLKARCLSGQQFSVDSNTHSSNRLDNFDTTRVLKAIYQTEQQGSLDSNKYLFNTFKCKRLPEEIIKKSNSPCLGKHTKYEIGFEAEKHFLKLLEVCRDEINYRTYYSKNTLVKEINSRQHGYPRPEWKSGDYYPRFDIQKSYKFQSQLETLEILLGSKELAKKYVYVEKGINITKWHMFHRGHLTPKTDFIYGPQQLTTFWFLNSNPQWGDFNSGNWFHLEKSVRNFATSRQLDLISYTGVHGIATLRDINGNKQLLYLHDNGKEKFLPVPRFFWKIIHEPISNRATAFIGLNEPRADKITEDIYLCPDLKNDYNFSWLTWEPNNVKLGVSYVCTVDSLRKAVPTVPEIGETGLLV